MDRNAAANGLQLLCEGLEDRARERSLSILRLSLHFRDQDLDIDDATQRYDS